LFQARDYERFAGHEVKLRLSVPVAGRRKFKGTLVGLRDEQVVVKMDDDEELVVPLHEVDQARLVPDYDSHRAAEGA
jgi:ribosome maturation factor RimP